MDNAERNLIRKIRKAKAILQIATKFRDKAQKECKEIALTQDLEKFNAEYDIAMANLRAKQKEWESALRQYDNAIVEYNSFCVHCKNK